MERMQEKSLKISVWESAQGLHVRINDSGEGIDRENLGKVFDPFFTTRSYSNHVGLGLPVAAGILKEHNAQMKLQSQRAKGTQVDIVFPPSPAVSAVGPLSTQAPVEAIDLPSELPKMTAPSHEEVAETMKDSEIPSEKLTDMNVDSLLELPPEDAPLQFLDGMGFESPSPAASVPRAVQTPPPVMAKPPPMTPPPSVVVLENKNNPAPPPPPSSEIEPEALPEVKLSVVPETSTSVTIDKPSPAPPPIKSSALDSYKVEVKRPGKRT
jgi:hypothetical protein